MTLPLTGMYIQPSPDDVRKTYEAVEQWVRKLLASKYDNHKAYTIGIDDNVIDELELDSLDEVEFVMAIEDADDFARLNPKLEIPDSVAENWTSIRDVVNYLMLFPAVVEVCLKK